VVGFGISGAEPSGYASREPVKIKFLSQISTVACKFYFQKHKKLFPSCIIYIQ
jgi:hypothetical protein